MPDYTEQQRDYDDMFLASKEDAESGFTFTVQSKRPLENFK